MPAEFSFSLLKTRNGIAQICGGLVSDTVDCDVSTDVGDAIWLTKPPKCSAEEIPPRIRHGPAAVQPAGLSLHRLLAATGEFVQIRFGSEKSVTKHAVNDPHFTLGLDVNKERRPGASKVAPDVVKVSSRSAASCNCSDQQLFVAVYMGSEHRKSPHWSQLIHLPQPQMLVASCWVSRPHTHFFPHEMLLFLWLRFLLPPVDSLLVTSDVGG